MFQMVIARQINCNSLAAGRGKERKSDPDTERDLR